MLKIIVLKIGPDRPVQPLTSGVAGSSHIMDRACI